MKIFTTHTKKIVVLILVFMLLLSTTMVYGTNYTVEEVEAIIDRIALERGVPSVLIKSIAYLESGLQHFNSNGTPKISRAGNIGLMQVGNYNNMFDTERLKYDIEYNINAGIDILLMKWNSSVKNNSISNVGNMDPNILENWYFALWAYNGWIARNNPNVSSNTYQDRIYNICSTRYNKTINKIDTSLLPASGNPSRGLTVETPPNTNSANIYLYKVNDLIVINSILDNKYICDSASGNYVMKVTNGQTAKITEGPVFKNGYYWYKILINNTTTGWIERNWISKIGDSQNGIYPFDDIIYHWCADSVMKLYNNGYISGKTKNNFCPDSVITKQEFCVLFSKITGIEPVDGELRFNDKDKIGDWATKYLVAMENEGLLRMYGDNMYPTSGITRGEITYLIATYLINCEKEKLAEKSANLDYEIEFNVEEAFNLKDVELPFKDIDSLSENQINYIKILYSKGLISGETNNTYNYNGTVTRAAAASVMYKTLETISNIK